MRNKGLKITGMLMAAGIIAMLAGCSGNAAKESETTATRVVPVKTTPVTQREFVSRIKAQGNLQAKEYAMVAARIDGILTDLFVKEGDEVKEGETKLFQVDKVKVTQAVDISKQDLALAKGSQREAKANLDSSQAQFDKAEIDYRRFKRLREKDAVTLDVMEQQEMRYKAMKAGLDHAKTVVDLAAEQVKKAEAALVIAEKNLSDSLVVAPISGRISYKFIQPNEFIGGGRPVVRIDNPAVLEMSALLPAENFGDIAENATQVNIKAYGIDVGAFPVSYKSPTIQPALRTFEIKCVIANPAAGVAAGAMADIEVILEKKTALGIPLSAVVERGGKKVVFAVEANTAKMVPVVTGLETDDWVEILDGALAADAPVVSMGQNLINDNTPVAVQKESA